MLLCRLPDRQEKAFRFYFRPVSKPKRRSLIRSKTGSPPKRSGWKQKPHCRATATSARRCSARSPRSILRATSTICCGPRARGFGSRPVGGIMAGYYAYIIDDDGHITNRVQIICDDDEEAKRCAERLVDGHAVELWQQACKIERFDPEDSRNILRGTLQRLALFGVRRIVSMDWRATSFWCARCCTSTTKARPRTPTRQRRRHSRPPLPRPRWPCGKDTKSASPHPGSETKRRRQPETSSDPGFGDHGSSAHVALVYSPGSKAWPRGSTDDLSLRTLGILAAGLALWIVYGLARADPVIVVANAVGLFLILFLMALKWLDA